MTFNTVKAWAVLGLLTLACLGCKGKSSDTGNSEDISKKAEQAPKENVENQTADESVTEPEKSFGPPELIELDAEKLLAAALTPEQLEQGWVNLFDGQSLYGWFVVGNANWNIKDGLINVSEGTSSFLCTSFQLADYELQVDFRSDKATNSGIFLRTAARPEDVAEGCLELNIAPSDNPFPTASFVERHKVETSTLGDFDPTEWHTYLVRVQGSSVTVQLDGEELYTLDDLLVNPNGHISLQHNSGKVEFRNILLRPILDGTELKLDDAWEEDWSKSEKEGQTLAVTPIAEGLKLEGGLGQLQTKQSFGDFVLHAQYTLAKPEVNSGIFFRCVPGAMLDGYECQVNHAIKDDNPLLPADAGAGAIFRRENARVVVGNGTTRSHVTLLANGPHFSTWVNGIQVAEFVDRREPDENPRRGLRLEPGPISLQGHDPTTRAVFHKIEIQEL